jgi:hypothetical protein
MHAGPSGHGYTRAPVLPAGVTHTSLPDCLRTEGPSEPVLRLHEPLAPHLSSWGQRIHTVWGLKHGMDDS